MFYLHNSYNIDITIIINNIINNNCIEVSEFCSGNKLFVQFVQFDILKSTIFFCK